MKQNLADFKLKPHEYNLSTKLLHQHLLGFNVSQISQFRQIKRCPTTLPSALPFTSLCVGSAHTVRRGENPVTSDIQQEMGKQILPLIFFVEWHFIKENSPIMPAACIIYQVSRLKATKLPKNTECPSRARPTEGCPQSRGLVCSIFFRS